MLEIIDLKTGERIPLEGSWYASENDIREYVTAAGFVDKVMSQTERSGEPTGRQLPISCGGAN